jgi:predicted transcriptional regulator
VAGLESLARYKLRLPTGKEALIVEGLRFCYDMSETDAAILFELLKGNKYTVDELTEKLKLSKATVNRSLAKLIELGFASREREKRAGVGRPRYRYYIDKPEEVVKRIVEDFEKCSKAFSEALSQILESLRKEKEAEEKS